MAALTTGISYIPDLSFPSVNMDTESFVEVKITTSNNNYPSHGVSGDEKWAVALPSYILNSACSVLKTVRWVYGMGFVVSAPTFHLPVFKSSTTKPIVALNTFGTN